jgi:hypothetical protein
MPHEYAATLSTAAIGNRSRRIMNVRKILDTTCIRDVNRVSFRNSSRKQPLKLSTKAFCIGLPGAI